MDNIREQQMPHPPDETRIDMLLHGWLPVVAALMVLAVSVAVDLTATQVHGHWTQRAGSIVTVLGAYVAYRHAKQSMQFVDNNFYINPELPFGPISVAMVVAGTLIWGYADLLL